MTPATSDSRDMKGSASFGHIGPDTGLASSRHQTMVNDSTFFYTESTKERPGVHIYPGTGDLVSGRDSRLVRFL